MKRKIFMKKYLIITTQRTGSSWLVDMLSSNQQIASYPELFRLTPETNYPSYGYSDIMFYEKWSKSKGYHKFYNLFKKNQSKYQEYFCEALKLNQTKEGIEAFGFKVMYQQIAANRGFIDFALGYFDKIIHLKRKNHLDVAVSKAYMERHKITHNPTGERPDIELDIRETVNYIKKLILEESKFTKILQQQAEGKVNTFFYEDLTADNEHEMSNIYHHIGVTPAAVASSFEKGNKNSLADIVTNYDELVTALANQGLTHYLDV